MATYLFKFPSGHVGIAVAPKFEELFDIIDEFGDPYSVVVKKLTYGAMCVATKDLGGDEGIIPFVEEGVAEGVEFSESVDIEVDPQMQNGPWLVPVWKRKKPHPVVAAQMGWNPKTT